MENIQTSEEMGSNHRNRNKYRHEKRTVKPDTMIYHTPNVHPHERFTVQCANNTLLQMINEKLRRAYGM